MKDVNLDPVALKEKYLAKKESKSCSVKIKQNKRYIFCNRKCINYVYEGSFSAGFKVTYLGLVHVGKQGDVKQIDKSVKLLLSPYKNLVQDSSLKSEKQKHSVFFEIGEIGVKIVDCETSEVRVKIIFLQSFSSFYKYIFPFLAGI